MYIEFTEPALGALVTSRAAFEATYAYSYDAVLICLQLIDSVHRISDLLTLACLQVLTIALVGGGTAITLTHRPSGLGLQFHPLDRNYQVVRQWADLNDLDGDTVSVTMVLGAVRAPVTAASK